MSRSLAGITIAVASVLSVAAPLPAGGGEPAAPDQEQLLAVLKSDAGRKERADACRLLARVATKDAVPALAALLADEELSHMARYALEPIQDPSVDEALREALGKTEGRQLTGVVVSLGVRRDARAVPALSDLLQHSDPATARAAARALGRIGTAEAARTLTESLAGAAADRRSAVADGCLACAEAHLAQGQRPQAVKIYALLAKADLPRHFRIAAMQGTLQTQQPSGNP